MKFGILKRGMNQHFSIKLIILINFHKSLITFHNRQECEDFRRWSVI